MNQTPPTSLRAARKTRTGIVVSDRMMKTRVVRVDRLVRHPRYPRVVRRSTTFKVHDEANTARVGDWVSIMETRPLSKDKRWRLVEVVRRASTAPAVPTSEPHTANKRKVSHSDPSTQPVQSGVSQDRG
ncbi:MAG: 30S ribosomal protein S17 [Candidatus Omnitrophica bacterium]|nr:30S ribosomal protein S17 [Candidatus Omnitrophota bacterium]